MARRDASLRLTLEDGAFGSGIRKLGNTVADSAQKMGQALKSRLHEGLHEGIHSVQHLTHRMHDMLHVVTAIGGTVSFVEMTHQALSAEEAAGRLAMKLRAVGDEHAHAGHVLESAVAMAKKFNLTTQEVLTGYEALVDKTGEPVFSQDAIGSVGLMRNAFHSTAEAAAATVAMFRKSLGASADEIESDFAPALHGTLVKAGITLEQFAPHAQDLGSLMYRAGMRGSEGLRQMVGLLGVAKDKGGDAESRLSGLRLVLDRLGTKKAVVAFGKEAGFDVAPILKMHTAMERLQSMLKSQKGVKALEGLFMRGGQKSFFEGLIAPLQEAHDKVLAEHGLAASATPSAAIAKAADAAGLAAFDRALKAAAESTTDEHKLREEAADTAQETERKLQLAMNRMASALENEKFLSAMSRLADVVPLVAEKFEKLVGLAIDHPIAGGAAVVGGTFLQGALGGIIAGKAVKHAAKHVAGHLAKGAAGAIAESAAVGAAETAATTAAPVAAAAAPAMTLAGAIPPLAAALLAGLGIKYVTESVSEAETNRTRQRQLVMGNADVALTSGSLERKKRALQELQEFMPESRGGRRGNVDKDVDAAKKQLQDQIEALGRANERQIASVEAVTRANERLARATTARGVNPPAPARPGSAPSQEAGDT